MRFQRLQVFVWCFVSAVLLNPVPQAQGAHAQQVVAPHPAPDAVPAQPPADSSPRDRRADEDWNSLALSPGTLHAEGPVPGGKDGQPEFTRELWQVQWRQTDPIDLYVIRPRGVEKPPAILYLYSYPSETDRFKDDGYCRRVTADGFAAIGFVSALTGQRYHTRPMKQWFVSELQESLVTSVHDVQMILNYLSTRGDVDMDRVGMFGQGSGGTIALLAAAVDPRIKALDVLDPWGDWPDWLAKSPRVPDEERANYLNPEFLKRVAPFDPVQWLPKLKTQFIRIQDVVDDPITPAICKKQIESAAAQTTAQIVKYDGAEALRNASSDGKLFRWIKDQLRSAPDRREAE